MSDERPDTILGQAQKLVEELKTQIREAETNRIHAERSLRSFEGRREELARSKGAASATELSAVRVRIAELEERIKWCQEERARLQRRLPTAQALLVQAKHQHTHGSISPDDAMDMEQQLVEPLEAMTPEQREVVRATYRDFIEQVEDISRRSGDTETER